MASCTVLTPCSFLAVVHGRTLCRPTEPLSHWGGSKCPIMQAQILHISEVMNSSFRSPRLIVLFIFSDMMVQILPALKCKVTQGLDHSSLLPLCLSTYQLCAIVSNVSSALMLIHFCFLLKQIFCQ